MPEPTLNDFLAQMEVEDSQPDPSLVGSAVDKTTDVAKEGGRAVAGGVLGTLQNAGDIGLRLGLGGADLLEDVPGFGALSDAHLAFNKASLRFLGGTLEGTVVGNYADTFGNMLDLQDQLSAVLPDATEEEMDEARDAVLGDISDAALTPESRPDWAQPRTFAGGMVSGVVQFALPFSAASKALKGASALRLFAGSGKARATANYLWRNTILGEGTGFVAFQGDEGRVADWIAEQGLGPLSENALVQFLKSDPNDSELTGRLKNAVEGSFIGPVFDLGLTAISKGLRATTTNLTPRQSRAGLSEAVDDTEALRTMAEAGTLPPEVAQQAGIDWDAPRNNLDGPSRTSFWESAREAGVEGDELTGAQALTDAYAARWAESTGKSVDAFYSDRLSKVVSSDADSPANGKVSFEEDGKALVTLFQGSDPSTLIHEVSHVFRRNLSDLDPTLQAKADEWVGAKTGAKWSRKQEEKWARSFELYLLKGEAPNEGLKAAFEQMKEMMGSVYASFLKRSGLSEDNLTLKPEIRDTFDSMFGKGYNKADVTKASPSSRSPGTPLESVRTVRSTYTPPTGTPVASKPPVYARFTDADAEAVQSAYKQVRHAPTTSKVKKAYTALADESRSQYDHVVESGHRFVFTSEEPYTSAQALAEDVEANGRSFVRLTASTDYAKGHPLAEGSGISATDHATGRTVELSKGDVLNAVHDYFGHAAEGTPFDVRGRENAWLQHRELFSEEARAALATEVRGHASSSKLKRKAGLLSDEASDNLDTVVGSRDTGMTERFKETLFQLKKTELSKMEVLEQTVASHTNLSKINTFDDAVQILLNIDKAYQSDIDGLIGSTQTLKEVQAEAASRGVNPGELVSDLASASKDVRKLSSLIVAGRTLKVSLAEETAVLSKKILQNPDDAQLQAAFVDGINALGKVDTLVGILTKETARATGSGRITVKGIPEGVVDKVLRQITDGDFTDSAVTDTINKATARGDTTMADALSGSRGKKRTQKVAQGFVEAQEIGSADRYARTLRTIDDPSVLDAFLEVYKSFLLSGTRTFSVNLGSGASKTYFQALERTLGAGARLGTKQGRADFKEAARFALTLHGAMADVAGMLVLNRDRGKFYTPDVRATAKKSIRQESPALYGDLTKGGSVVSTTESKKAVSAGTFGLRDDSSLGKGVNALGRVVRTPFLVNMLGEDWWSQVNYLAYVRNKALTEADAIFNDTSLTPAQQHIAAGDFVDSYVRNSFDDFGSASRSESGDFNHADAIRYAKSVNFMQDLEFGLGQYISEGKQKFPLLDLVVPFIKAPTNLFRSAANYAILPGMVIQRNARKAGITREQWEIDKNRGEMMLGAMMMTFAAYLAGEGRITGGGPVNADEREVLEATGWKPYSFASVGPDGRTEYKSFSRADPQASVFGLVADLTEVLPYLETNEQEEAVQGALTGLAQNFSSKTYLRGVSDAIRAITQPERYGERYVNGLIANAVPNLSRTIAGATDENLRETYTLLDEFKARIPGLSETLPPRRNILGEPITPSGGYVPFVDGETVFAKMASPAAYSKQTTNKALLEMARLQVGFSMPGRTLDGVDMTLYQTTSGQNAYDRYLELSGTLRIGDRRLAEALNELVASDSYNSLPEPTGDAKQDQYNPRVRQIQDVLTSYRRAAKSALQSEVPKLREEILRRKVGGASGVLTPTGSGLDVIDRLLSQ